MSNPFFKFKQFTVYHDRSTMKVGTDGVLLGAWTPFTGKEKHVLDIGTGCGLVALMLAQRIHNAQITGIDIDVASVGQANENFQASPWPERLKAELVPVQELSCQTDLRYDLIVSNPPFFVSSLPNPRQERMQARHTCTLSHEDLLHAVVALLEPQGTFALVLPVHEGQHILTLEDMAKNYQGRVWARERASLMQLLYLNFTAPRYDKQSFEVVRKMIMANLENIAQNPQYVFKDSLNNTIYGHNPKAQMFNKNMAEKMDYDRMYQIYKERFANAADFEFVFCGNIDMDKMRTLVEQYVATLPASKGREKVANDGKTYAKGIVTNTFKRKTETNQAMLAMIWSGNLKNTMENRAKISITGQLMSNELLNRVRENEGAAYSPYAGGAIVSTYEDKFVIESMFGLNPDKREISEKLTIACLEDLAKNIPETELNKMKEFMVKQYIQSTQDNGFWVDAINSWVLDGLDKVNNYREMIEKLTPKEMQSFISSLVKQGNRIEVIMMPE